MEKPLNPQFSSGPCPKRPGWSLNALKNAPVGRSHRAAVSKDQLLLLISKISEILNLPEGYEVGIVPASDTGAFEMAMWNLLGPNMLDVLYWENFGRDWEVDIVEQLKIKDVQVISSDYGSLPNLNLVRPDSDVCFTWNGTTSGVKVQNADWLGESRQGLVLCDATSAIFAQSLDWEKLDVATFSWQKVMGGEGGHGVIILSPKAIKRLKSYTPDWPIPKIFRLKEGGKIKSTIFSGETINTPSMLCVHDALDSLSWIEDIGGIKAVEARSNENASLVQTWLDQSKWAENLVKDINIRSNTNICIDIVEPKFKKLSEAEQRQFVTEIAIELENHDVAYDLNGYPAAPPGFRIYTGATVEKINIERLLPWLDHTYYKYANRLP